MEKIKNGKISEDQKLIDRAFEFAKKAHQGQKRLSGEDYISHPLGVADILAEMKMDVKTIAAGLLHDVLEDNEKIKEDDLKQEFGEDIAFLVSGVTKLEKLPFGEIERQAENLRKLFLATAQDLRVILIKLADRLDNLKTLNFHPKEKQKRIALETIEIYAPIASRLGMGEIRGQLEDIAFSYLYPEDYKWLLEQVQERYEERKKYLERLKPNVIEALKEEEINPVDAHTRAKHYYSLWQKLKRYEMDFEKIYDLTALRIIVPTVENCYETLGILHRLWKPLPGRIKDYIALPKPNGYRSLHTTVFCEGGKITEIQIRTPEMHGEAEYGIAAHWAYKGKMGATPKEYHWVRQLQDWQKKIGSPEEFIESLRIDFFKDRIFVFTPKGDVLDLPEGSTPIDFAFQVHTDVGQRCGQALVNGKITALNIALQSGDMVEIIAKKGQKPSRDWLRFAKTGFAKSQIRKFLRAEAEKEIVKLEEKQKIVAREPASKEKSSEIPSKARPYQPFDKKSPIRVGGEKNILISLAKCCSPFPDDQILAFITKNRGAKIHKAICRNLINAKTLWPQRVTPASWQSQEGKFFAALLLKTSDRIGLVQDISSTISNLGVNMLDFDAHGKKTNAQFKITLEISSLSDLNYLIKKLQQVEGVKEVKRL